MYKQVDEIRSRSCEGCVAKHNIPLCLELNNNKFGECHDNKIIFVEVIDESE